MLNAGSQQFQHGHDGLHERRELSGVRAELKITSIQPDFETRRCPCVEAVEIFATAPFQGESDGSAARVTGLRVQFNAERGSDDLDEMRVRLIHFRDLRKADSPLVLTVADLDRNVIQHFASGTA